MYHKNTLSSVDMYVYMHTYTRAAVYQIVTYRYRVTKWIQGVDKHLALCKQNSLP